MRCTTLTKAGPSHSPGGNIERTEPASGHDAVHPALYTFPGYVSTLMRTFWPAFTLVSLRLFVISYNPYIIMQGNNRHNWLTRSELVTNFGQIFLVT